jgi:hypothetical protein
MRVDLLVSNFALSTYCMRRYVEAKSDPEKARQLAAIAADRAEQKARGPVTQGSVGAVQVASSSPIARNRSTYQLRPFYLSGETVLPIR